MLIKTQKQANVNAFEKERRKFSKIILLFLCENPIFLYIALFFIFPFQNTKFRFSKLSYILSPSWFRDFKLSVCFKKA